MSLASHEAAATSPTSPPLVPAPRRRRRVLIASLIPLQLFLAAGWLRAGTEKVIDPSWWTAAALRGFLEEQHPEMLPWFTWFADAVVTPSAPLIAWVVLTAQLAVGGCMLTNRYVRPALWIGIVLNVSFTMAGRVNPSAFYLVMEITLLFALSHPVSEAIAIRRAVAWLIPATFILPFARTLHPRDVIDDPALMLVFLCVIASVSTIATSVPVERMVELAAWHRLGRVGCKLLGVAGLAPDGKVSGCSGDHPVPGDVVGGQRRSGGNCRGLDVGVHQ